MMRISGIIKVFLIGVKFTKYLYFRRKLVHLGMIEKRIQIAYLSYDLNELPAEFHQLVEKAKEAAQDAYAPYSNFKVGAAVLLDNGLIFKGNNQENAAYPSGLCAERVALFYANANYPKSAITQIAITAYNDAGMVDTPVAPCGSCRQVLLETENRFHSSMKVILVAAQGIYVFSSAADLLPNSFDASFLKSK